MQGRFDAFYKNSVDDAAFAGIWGYQHGRSAKLAANFGATARLKARNNARWHLRVLGRRLEHRRNFIPVSNSDQKLLLGLHD